MGIKQLCDTINAYFSNSRQPFPQLSRILLVCSMIKRPGLSTLQSTSNIVKDLARLGIPTGPMPDGSANLTVGVMFASTKEIYRGIKKDMSIQVGTTPGTQAVMGMGANAGGPVSINGTNMSCGMAYGMAN